MALLENLCMVSCSPSIVTMVLCCIISEIKRGIGRKSRFFSFPCIRQVTVGALLYRLGWKNKKSVAKLRWKSLRDCLVLSTEYLCVTDWQTDRHHATALSAHTRCAIIKKNKHYLSTLHDWYTDRQTSELLYQYQYRASALVWWRATKTEQYFSTLHITSNWLSTVNMCCTNSLKFIQVNAVLTYRYSRIHLLCSRLDRCTWRHLQCQCSWPKHCNLRCLLHMRLYLRRQTLCTVIATAMRMMMMSKMMIAMLNVLFCQQNEHKITTKKRQRRHRANTYSYTDSSFLKSRQTCSTQVRTWTEVRT